MSTYTGINVADIVSEYGSYYREGQGNLDRLVRKLLGGSETLSLPGVKHIKTDATVYETANVFSSEAVQAYQHGFTPKGSATFVPNRIMLQHVKVDQLYEPDSIEDNWLGFLAGKEGDELKDWPIVRYLLEQVLAERVAADRETMIHNAGDATTVTAGTAHPLDESFNGFDSVCAAAIDEHNPYPAHLVGDIGELTAEDIFDQVEAFTAAIDSKLRNTEMIYFMAPEMARAYLLRKRALGFYNVAADDQINLKVDFTAHRVFGAPGMAGQTSFLFATPAQNILHLTKRDFSARNLKVQEQDRDVKVMADWWEGVGFADNDLLYVATAV